MLKSDITKDRGGDTRQLEFGASTLLHRRYLWLTLACLALMAGVMLSDLYGTSIQVSNFIPLHMMLELSSIVVSFAVFATGWHGYRQTGNLRDLIIGVTFLVTGTIDLIHTMTYKGMPNFLGINTPGKAAAYWLLARIAVGCGLLGASFVSPRARAERIHARLFVVLSGALVTAATAVFTIYGDQIGNALYSQVGRPPSALKSGIELLAVALYLAAFVLVTERRGWERDVVVDLRSALLVAAFAEAAFMLYVTPFAWMNALGHIYKTAAYYLILNALFAAAIRRPYQQLSQARDELQSLYEDAREHREEMERSFAHIGSALSSSLKPEEALNLIADLAAQMQHVNCSVVVSFGKPGTQAQITAQRGTCHEPERPLEVTLAVGRETIERGTSVIVNNLAATGWIDCDFTSESCLRSMACAPMILDSRPLGLVAVFSYRESAFEEGDARLLEGFAAHAAVAIDNALTYERESHIANVLQKSFLTSPKLQTDGFEIAQVYQPASDEALVGGDFYDVFELPDGKIGLAIGDVSGKGLTAAVHTAMVRYALRAYAEEGHSPGTALRLLDSLISKYAETDTFITMFFGLLDTHSNLLVYANAGHEPPICICNSAGITLPATGSVLGVGIGSGYEEGTLKLERGCVLLLYTDGISEARRGARFLGIEGITAELTACRDASSQDVARCIHRAAVEFAGGELRDDAAVLAVRVLK